MRAICRPIWALALDRPRRMLLAVFCGAFAMAAWPQPASATDTITLIVATPPGGSADRLARITATTLQPVVEEAVETRNIPGPGGVAGTGALAKAAPDGRTLGLLTSTPLVAGRLLSGQADYNPIKDFDWLAVIGTYANAVVVRNDHPARTFDEWLESARSATTPLKYSSPGIGTPSHLAGEFLRTEARANLQHIPLPSGTPDAYPALSQGAVDVVIDGLPAALGAVGRGGFRVLAVTSEKRHPAVPDVPAFGEIWKGESFVVFAVVAAPRGLPDPVRIKLASAAGVLVLDRNYVAQVSALGIEFLGLTGARATDFVQDEFVRHARLIAKYGITARR